MSPELCVETWRHLVQRSHKAYIQSYPSDANKNFGIGRPSDESEEWYKAVTIYDDCPKKVRCFADKLSTKMVEEAVAPISRESLNCVK
jgi:hypothetical protein